MVLSLIWVESCRFTQLTLWNWITLANLCLTVYWCFPSTMWTYWLSTNMAMGTLHLLHSTAIWSAHWRFWLISELVLVRIRLFTHYALIMMLIVLDWAILLLIWILCCIIWLEHGRCAWTFLFGTTYCSILLLRLRCLDGLRGCNDGGGFFKYLFEIQSTCCRSLFFLDFCIIKFH